MNEEKWRKSVQILEKCSEKIDTFLKQQQKIWHGIWIPIAKKEY